MSIESEPSSGPQPDKPYTSFGEYISGRMKELPSVLAQQIGDQYPAVGHMKLTQEGLRRAVNDVLPDEIQFNAAAWSTFLSGYSLPYSQKAEAGLMAIFDVLEMTKQQIDIAVALIAHDYLVHAAGPIIADTAIPPDRRQS